MYARSVSACWSSFLVFSLSFSLSRADHESFIQNDDYNAEVFGEYVTQDYKSSDVRAPILNVYKPFTNCDDGSYLFISPRGAKADSSPYILDARGNLIWTPERQYGEVYNVQVQQYKGEDYLCFWGGNDAVGGHGEGQVYIFDKHYEQFKTVRGGNGLGLDLHSFTITNDNTATFTGYDVVERDLAGTQGKDGTGWIWDSLFQELDLDTQEVIFQWRASDHMKLADSYNHISKLTRDEPWDWFHINCVEKDAAGNYLVSSRYMRAVIYVSGETGEVLWQLGGRSNSFEDLSGGAATNTIGQHDAHWADEPGYHRAITFFDNRSDWTFHSEHESRGTRVEVDLDKMTARLNATFVNPVAILSTSQGSYQSLPNGHVVIGYGINGVMTEFDGEGNVLCDMYFEPKKAFGSGNVQSYRNMKFNWTGLPNTTPKLVEKEGSLYMSWLGSTEVRKWLIQDALTADDDAYEVLSLPKVGFETRLGLSINIRIRQFVQVVALGADDQILSTSERIDIGDRATVHDNDELLLDEEEDNKEDQEEDWSDEDESEQEQEEDHDEDMQEEVEDLQLLVGLGFLAMLSGILVCWMSFGTRIFKPLSTAQNEYASKEWTAEPARRPWQRLWAKLQGKKASWHRAAQEDDEEEAEVMLEDQRRSPRIVGGNVGIDDRCFMAHYSVFALTLLTTS